jgi:hypothetical protein
MNRRPVFEIQELEARRLLSVTRPTLADRQEIMANWSGPNAHYLSSLLQRGYTAAFDQTLLTYMENRTGANYYFSPSDVPSDVSFVESHLPQQVTSAIAGADQTVEHLFPLQVNSAENTVQLGSTISWDTLPAGVTSENFLHGLNEMNFWPGLALAYRFTNDSKYANELASELQSWTQQNPPLPNANDWPNTEPRWWLLDAASRVDNWVFTYETMLGTSGWTAAENTLFLHEMLLHGEFLSAATPGPLTSNQTIQQAQALAEVGMMFPEFGKAAVWKSQGMNLLFQCANTQILSDGGQDEESPGYQGNVLSNLLSSYQLSVLNDVPWTRAEYRKLLSTAQSFYELLSPDGTEPAFGDTYRQTGLGIVTNASIVLGTPGTLFTRARIRDVFTWGQAAALQSFNVTGTEDLSGRGVNYAMPASGYWIARSGEDRNARQVIMDAGPTGGSTHGHFDLLSFELYGYGQPLIAQPGPYQIDGSADRKYVVSTASQNTINVDGLSHAEEDGVGNPNIVFDGETISGTDTTWTAHHFAYSSLKGSPAVGRTIWFNGDDTMLVVDFASSTTTHTFTSGFNLPGTASYINNGEINSLNSTGNVMIQSLLLAGQSTKRTKTFVSSQPPPDEITPATRYSVSQTGTSALIANLIVTFTGSMPPTVTATWVTLPKGTRNGVIKITRNGVSQLVSIPVPPLSTHTPDTLATPATRR